MKKICAWCGKTLDNNSDTEKDSHGICEKCKKCMCDIEKNDCPDCNLKGENVLYVSKNKTESDKLIKRIEPNNIIECVKKQYYDNAQRLFGADKNCPVGKV